MQIVLFEPEIPPNTGNIARLCAATGTPLHLIEPLGFRLEDRYLKRAGLDYWPLVSTSVWKSWAHFKARAYPLPLSLRGETREEAPKAHRLPGERLVMVSSKKRPQSTPFHLFPFSPNDILVYGPETRGLPDSVLADSTLQIRVPMRPESVRSLNLSTCAGIVLYMALERTGLPSTWC